MAMAPSRILAERWTARRTLVLFVLLAATPGAVLGALLAYTTMFPEPGRLSNTSPVKHGLAYKSVSIRSADGVMLVGWDVPGNSTAQVVLIVHGSGGSAEEHIKSAEELHRAGFSVILANLRRHGGSGTAMKTFGLNEALDVEAFVDYAAQVYPGCRIGVLSESMGSVATLLAASTDRRISAIVVDSAFSSFVELVRHRLRQALGRLAGESVAPFALLAGSALTGRPPWAWNAADAARHGAARPVLIIHGDQDFFVPSEAPYELRDAVQGAEMWIVRGAQHCQTRKMAPEKYASRVGTFFAKALGSPPFTKE
jgi:uncharacterized protein